MAGYATLWGFVGETGQQGPQGAPGQQGPKGDPGIGTISGMTINQLVYATGDAQATSTPVARLTQDGLAITYNGGGVSSALDVFDADGTTPIFQVQNEGDNQVRVGNGYSFYVDGGLVVNTSAPDPSVIITNNDNDIGVFIKDKNNTDIMAVNTTDATLTLKKTSAPAIVLSPTGFSLYDNLGLRWCYADSNTKTLYPSGGVPVKTLTLPVGTSGAVVGDAFVLTQPLVASNVFNVSTLFNYDTLTYHSTPSTIVS